MKHTQKLIFLSLLLAVSLILSYIESLVPLPIAVPGVKLGLANIASVVSLYAFGFWSALILVIMRVLLAGFMFGSMSSILYAMAGGVLSVIVMGILMHVRKKQKKWSLTFVSIIGAITHNCGQVLVAAFVIENTGLITYYLPFLILLAIPTGLAVGVLSTLLIKALKKSVIFEGNQNRESLQKDTFKAG